MSVTGISDPHRLHNKPLHRRHDSGELDVFEAARYFSGSTDFVGSFAQREEKKINYSRNGRISLDMPMRSNPVPQFTEKQIIKEKKKHKQPSSPGSRLANFLNSLFNQAKKKSKSAAGDDESPGGGRRRRRSSISHFRSSSAAAADSKSIYSSSNSGFRTPPPYSHTPVKIYKDLRNFSDHERLVSLPKHNTHAKQSIASQNDTSDGKRARDRTWVDEKFKYPEGFSEKLKNLGAVFAEKDRISNGFPEKLKNPGNGCSETERIWGSKYQTEVKDLKKFNEVDDGAESDSSSDLFELENYDLGYYSNDLPVYETTHMDSIKRGATITNGGQYTTVV